MLELKYVLIMALYSERESNFFLNPLMFWYLIFYISKDARMTLLLKMLKIGCQILKLLRPAILITID